MNHRKIFRNVSVLFVAFVLETNSYQFSITRPQRKEESDIFTNDRALGKCRNQNGRNFCQRANAECGRGDSCCECKCRYMFSTFYMHSLVPLRYQCVKNQDVRQLTGI